MIIYLCIKFQSNAPIFSKDIARKPFVLHTGQTDGTDGHTDCGDTIYPPPPTPTENGGGGGHKKISLIWTHAFNPLKNE